MKLYSILFILLISNIFGQTTYLSEDFEDNNLDGWGQNNAKEWIVSEIEPITGSFSLKHNLDDTTGSSHIYHPLTNLNLNSGTTTWRFNLKKDNWNPSNENKFWVYLAVDDTTNVSGYAIGVNLSEESGRLTLSKLTESSADGTIIISDFDWTTNNLVGIEVTRDSSGLWELKYDSTGNFENLISAGTGTDTTYTTTNYFGLTFYFTSIGAGGVWLDDITVSQIPTLTSIKYISNLEPVEFKLNQNYPNPFNPLTTLKFNVPKNTDMLELSVYNVLGKKVKTLFIGNIKAGNFSYKWNGKNSSGKIMPTGIYFAILKTNNFTQSIKMMLVK